jgi:electron transfer flavoprotein alpha/beta subunit
MRTVALVDAPDAAVVRAALALGETLVATIAPDGSEAAALVARARAAGAVRAVRLWDEALAAADYLGLATALAATARTLAGELGDTVILCGDRGRGAIGPAVAERLALPHLGRVIAVELDGARLVVRRLAAARAQRFAATPPVVLCMAVAVDERALEGPEAAVDAWTLGDVGLTPAEVAYRRRFRPELAAGPTHAPLRFDSPAALVERLRADGLLPPAKGN